MQSKILKISQQYYDDTNLEHRKKHGQYFTPVDIKSEALSLIEISDGDSILENSCGTGEFIHSILEINENVNIDAFDIDQKLVDIVSENFDVNAQCQDFLLLSKTKMYDKAIGNPPYFQMKKADAVEAGYENYLDVCAGKPNIYAMFIKASIDALKVGGELVYVVPTSMNNGNDFRLLREYIIEKTNIKNIKLFNDDCFDSAQQNVMILHLEKLAPEASNDGNYVFTKSGITIFSTDTDFLYNKFENGYTLEELGFDVMTGNLVWNQNKPLMSRDNNDLKLVWACNLVDNQITLDVPKLNAVQCPDEKRATKHEKGQYVKKKIVTQNTGVEIKINSKPLTGKCIVVNRVTGASANAKIRAAIVDFGEEEYFVENHLNYIIRKQSCKYKLEDLLTELIKPEVTNFVKKITGNTQISKKELLKLIPIKLDKID
jgi:adenine-specific DNA-methyltransferase